MNGEWSKIYDEHSGRVRAILYRMCLAEDFDDLVQECFIKIWQGLAKFRGDSSVKTWVTRITLNTAYDYFRRKGRDPARESLDESIATPLAKDFSDGEVVRSALNGLSIPHREVLVLHILEEYSLQEIADLTEVPIGTVKSRLFHAREYMKRVLEQNGVKYG